MATIAPILVIIQQMVYKLLNEQVLGEDKYIDLDHVTEKAIGIIFSLK